MTEEDEGKSFPRNEWVKAESSHHPKHGTLRETHYMLLPHGAMMRTYTAILEVVSDDRIPRRAKAITTSEALCFIPGSYTLKVKGNNRDIVVLELM